MDSTEIILLLLTVIAVTLAVGLAGIVYLLGNLFKILARLRAQIPGEMEDIPVPAETTVPEKEPAVPLEAVNVQSVTNLQEYLVAIGEKYHLASYTLATIDGLVIGSTRPDVQEEAAEFSYIYAQGKQPEAAGVELIGVQHHGETVVGIARTEEHLPTDLVSALEQDTRDALQHWV
jgi:hypothetical protein